MDNLENLIQSLHHQINDLSKGANTNFMKASAMSEIVYELLDEIGGWSKEQQLQSIDLIRQWLAGTEMSEINLQHDPYTEQWIKPILTAVVTKAPTDLDS